MHFDDKVMDEIRVLHLSKIAIEDIAVHYDYDSTEDFIKELALNLNGKAYSLFLAQASLSRLKPLEGAELTKARKYIEKVRSSPKRINRLLLNKVVRFAKSLSTFEQIMKATGKTKAELLELITEEEVIRLNEEALCLIREKEYNKAMVENDTKTLIHIGTSYIEAQKPKKEDVNINVDNRTIKYVELPKPDDTDDFTKYWNPPKQLDK